MNLFEQTGIDEYVPGSASQDALLKALSAGSGTDSASMTGGRSLIPQDIEMTMVNALAVKPQDFKVMNLLKKQKIESTIHEYTRRNDAGGYENVFVAEGGESSESDQDLERVAKPMKFLQTYREVTLQMQVSRTIEGAVASEKTAGTLVILKGAEYSMFHGNSAVVPEQFDSLQKQILTNASRRNLLDLRGKKMTDAGGEESISTIAQMVYDNGGYLSHCYMPSVIAQDFQALARDRLRLNPADRKGAAVIEEYPTPFSDPIKIAGKEAGPDKMFRVKGPVSPNGDTSKRPSAPTFALAAQNLTSGGGPGFVSDNAGTYYYTVFAVNKYGISAGATAASVAAAAGKEVKITITPGETKGTGYIICRSKKDAADGSDCREMVRVADSGSATTVILDQNSDLPGTGELVYLSHDIVEPSIQWDQLLPLMKFDLFPSKSAVTPFLVILFGTPDVKVPWFHGVVKNVGYTGLGWY